MVLATVHVESYTKRYTSLRSAAPLNLKRLRLLEVTPSIATDKQGYASMWQSSRSSQAYFANDVRFENAWRDFHVDIQEAE